jgi:signal transduction histidine kinase
VRFPGFADLPLNKKLTLLFTVASGVALLIFAAALWVYQSDVYHGALLREMSALSQTLADSSAAALAFRDDKSARETLEVLRAEPRVYSACLYRNGNVLVAAYSANKGKSKCPALPGPDRSSFSDANLTVVQTSRLKGEVAGQLYLLVDLGDIYQQLRQLAFMCFGALGVSLLLAAIVASRLQRLISGPILDLAAVASRVSILRDYSIRAPRKSRDELGVLVEKFNEMMEQVYERDIALERAQAELEDRVRDRTGELRDEIAMRRLVEQDLIVAKEVAEESNRAKSAILANMSHELRTPLNAIILYSEMLQEDAAALGNEAGVADLRCVVTAARHLLSLINDILDLSKAEAGRMEIHSEPTGVCGLIADVSATIRPLAWKKGNEFVTDLPEEDYVVDVDATRFRQSLMNLLSNACKFTEHGTVSLTVIREVSDGRGWVCFEVRDTGPGIAPEDLGKLFKTFSQVDSSATRKYGGSGLGLAISQRFCQMMGGAITVVSAPGQGAAFTIRLPESNSRPGVCPPEGIGEIVAQ